MKRLSPPLWRRVAMKMRQHLPGESAKALQRELSRWLHVLWRALRRAAQHGLGIVHHLRREQRRVVGVRGHVRHERHQHRFEGHNPAAKLGIRHLAHDFFPFVPAFRVGLPSSEEAA